MLPGSVWQKVLTVASVPNITDLFGPSLSGSASIYLASDSRYSDRVTQRWTRHASPSYLGAIQPATVGDVQNIIKIAASNHIPFIATGGGHGLSVQLAHLQNGLQVDLQKFNSVRFDPDTQLLTVGGAVKFSHIIEPLSASGYQFPLGTAYCVGLVGSTLGGGVSANQGYMGLLADLLEEVQLVTAAGDLVTASRRLNTDLFWAVRGAGANFGVVTSATFRVPRAVNGGRITQANYMFPSAEQRSVWEYLSSVDEDLPATMALNLATFPDGNGKRALVLNVQYAGTYADAAPYLKAIQALQPTQTEILENIAWPDVFKTSYFGIPDTKACGRNQHVNMRSVGANRSDVDSILEFVDELDHFSEAHPDLTAAIVVHRFPTQKVLEVPSDETAYPHRQLKMHIQLEIESETAEKDGIMDQFLDSARSNFSKSSGFEAPVTYVNFAHGDEGAETWYGKHNLERLVRLKREWDPEGLFSFSNAVPTSLGSEKPRDSDFAEPLLR